MRDEVKDTRKCLLDSIQQAEEEFYKLISEKYAKKKEKDKKK